MSEAQDLFTRLGGTRAMADRLSEPPSTVQSWKVSGRIPAGKQPAVLALGVDKDGVPITADDVVFPLGRHQHGVPGGRVAADEPAQAAA